MLHESLQYHRVARGLDAEVAFSAGLLHDIGKLITCCFLPDEYKLTLEYRQERQTSDYQAEMASVGHAHTHIGRMLAANWKLPVAIQRAIEFHHFPMQDTEDSRVYSIIIHVANYLAKRTFGTKMPQYDDWTDLLPEVHSDLELTEEVIEAFCSKLREEYAASSTFMQLAMA